MLWWELQTSLLFCFFVTSANCPLVQQQQPLQRLYGSLWLSHICKASENPLPPFTTVQEYLLTRLLGDNHSSDARPADRPINPGRRWKCDVHRQHKHLESRFERQWCTEQRPQPAQVAAASMIAFRQSP
jgi:hypothetical protein